MKGRTDDMILREPLLVGRPSISIDSRGCSCSRWLLLFVRRSLGVSQNEERRSSQIRCADNNKCAEETRVRCQK
jgi:hypothetical protein